jgi:hypothetical protein
VGTSGCAGEIDRERRPELDGDAAWPIGRAGRGLARRRPDAGVTIEITHVQIDRSVNVISPAGDPRTRTCCPVSGAAGMARCDLVVATSIYGRRLHGPRSGCAMVTVL